MAKAARVLTPLERRIMRVLWDQGPGNVQKVLQSLTGEPQLAYTTVQTVVNRLEGKRAIRRAKKISNAHVFEAVISQASAQTRMIDEMVAWFGGKPLPIMTHLIESGTFTEDEIREARKALRNWSLKGKSK